MKRDVGNCGQHHAIETQEDCNTAAKDLGLSSLSSAITSQQYPYGCYYMASSNQKLYFNSDGDRESTDSIRVSICELGPHREMTIGELERCLIAIRLSDG